MFSARPKFRALALASAAAVAVSFAVPARAQTDTSYFVGAIFKSQITALGTAPAVTTIAAGGAAQTLAWPAYGSNTYDITLTANLTLTLGTPTIAAGQKQSVNVVIRNPTGGYTVTFPTGVKWNNGTAPTVVTTAGTILNYSFETTDGGTTVLAK
jgi:hypothetical protein